LPTNARNLPFRTLEGPLTEEERRGLRTAMRALLAWQRDLRAWTPCRRAPDATPFVALYARGRLFGCFGSDEGLPGERLARAFLRALSDVRFGGIDPADRNCIVAEVSYLRGVRRRTREQLLAELEPGTHGIGLLRERGAPAVLLPSVARIGSLTGPQLLATLLRKAAAEDAERLEFFLFDCDSTICRMGDRVPILVEPRDAAAAWLSRLVLPNGAVAFATDVKTGGRQQVGPMHHGRSAAVLQALAQHGEHPRQVARGIKWLEREAREALAGHPPPGWPSNRAQVAGTLALAVLAGAKLRAELVEFVRGTLDLGRTPWHAAQAVTALGVDAPAPLWRACVEDLDHEPWSPWTTLAARTRGDATTLARAERALVSSIRSSAPYMGGVVRNKRIDIPEVALTAIAVEALAPSRSRGARAAVARGRRFLLRWQISEQGPASAHPASFGAFPASPIATVLRGDITAHALVALATD